MFAKKNISLIFIAIFYIVITKNVNSDIFSRYETIPTVVHVDAKDYPGKLTFRPLLHQPRIYFGAPPGVHVTTIHAYDPEKPRKKVEYSLPEILDHEFFIIDQTSGNLTTASHIDRAINETYEVMVTAVSTGSSELEHLQIVVTEFNQYAPRFQKRSYTVDMHVNTEVNTTILKVKATDPDVTVENSEIYYKMDQNRTTKYFYLDYITGDLILIQPINETESVISFGIFAEDGGSPKRWDYIPIYILLKNISAPHNIKVQEITHAAANICWEEPDYGDVSGYSIIYHSPGQPSKTVNLSVDYDSDVCYTLNMLNDETEYQAIVYAWNENEKGVLPAPVLFKTSKDWCKTTTCNGGTCENILEEPWFFCHCKYGYYGPFCELFNPCVYEPCGSNGVCHNVSHNQYTCDCFNDYYGANCELYNPCVKFKDFCLNGGTCISTIEKRIACICADGFYGRQCNMTDPCLSNSCFNGGTCQEISNKSSRCICPNGFEGKYCEFEINHCDPNPCAPLALCISNRDNYTCLCPQTHYGKNCTKIKKCSKEKVPAMNIMYTWQETNVGNVMKIPCPYGEIDSLNRKGYIGRPCLLKDGMAIWGEISTSVCKTEESIISATIKAELQNVTKNPESLDVGRVDFASEGIRYVAKYTVDKKVAQDVVNIVSNVLEVNNTVFEESDNKAVDQILESIDMLTSNIKLEPGERLNLNAENVRIETLDWHPELETESEMFEDSIELTAPMDSGIDVEEKEDEDEYSKIYPSATSPSFTEDSLSPNITSTARYPNVTEGTTTQTYNVTMTTQKPKLPVFQVFVPKEALQEAHRQLEKSVRLKFVVYYNDKLFQPKKSQKPTQTPVVQKNESISNDTVTIEEPLLNIPVLQISVGDVSLKNLQKPFVYILPMVTSRKATCVFWNTEERQWATEGLETEQTFDKVICKSSHMTAFTVLLDLDPDIVLGELDSQILSILSYMGSTLSITGLTMTLLTYSLFKCLNRDRTGQILINLCFSLLMMNIAFLTGSSSLISTKNACGIIAVMIHYFVLASLSWMCVEAINMHQLLVHVFASSETHFMLKRMLVAWGAPLAVALGTAFFKFDAYRLNRDACVMSSDDPWIYYTTYMLPCCLILIGNTFVFVRVCIVICTPKLTVRASHRRNTRITAVQVRGAIAVMVLLGITWVFGTLAFGRAKVVFSYFFVISSSMQGCLIFIVRCLLYAEARNAWIYLIKTGKFKTHRGVLPPGLSYNSNSGFRSGLSPISTTQRMSSSDDPQSSGSNRASKLSRNSPRQMSFRYRWDEQHPYPSRHVRRSPVERSALRHDSSQFYPHDHFQRHNRYDSFELEKRCEKEDKHNAFKWRSPHFYQQETRYHPSSRQRSAEITPDEIICPTEFSTAKLAKKQNCDANKGKLSGKLHEPDKDKTRCPNIPSIFCGRGHKIPKAIAISSHKGIKSGNIEEAAYSDDTIKKDTIVSDFQDTYPRRSSSIERRKQMGRLRGTRFSYKDDGVHSEASGSTTDFDDVYFEEYYKKTGIFPSSTR